MRFIKYALPTLTLAIVLGATISYPVRAGEPVSLMHVHGMSYSADGRQLLIPSHQGMAIHENGRWSKAPGPAHDYMGFSATRDALYSSGHPAPDTGQINPFGLIKSRDGGKTWQKLGLEGESDFHLVATGYRTNALYVVNQGLNSRMNQAGIFHTRNDGFKWTRANAAGLGGQITSLAVHPSDAAVVAAGTVDGLYLSRNSAENFERLVDGQRVLAVTFDQNGQHLWFGTQAGKAALRKIALKAGAKAEELPIPALPDDAIAYIAQNPLRPSEMAIATFKRNVFVSKDQGRSWTQIAKNGATKD